jgi:NADPH:quinone reductase
VRALVNAPSHDDRIAFAYVDEPVATPDEAVVAIAGSSLNRGEQRLLATRPAGCRPGQDIAGTAVAAAADGSGPAEGSRDVALVEQAGWVERVAIPTDRIATLPDSVSFPVAATLPIAGLTALRTLRLGGDLRGRRVLITPGSGAVGRFQIQLAARRGGLVTAVANERHHEALTPLGAAVVQEPGAADGPFWLITDSIGGHSLTSAITQIDRHGTVVVFGASGPETTPMNFRQFVGRESARIQTFMSFASGPGFGADLALLPVCTSIQLTTVRRKSLRSETGSGRGISSVWAWTISSVQPDQTSNPIMETR